jgi:hypothetical protein
MRRGVGLLQGVEQTFRIRDKGISTAQVLQNTFSTVAYIPVANVALSPDQ